MPDIIQLLPDSVANQIAAGEVIQRPASVVKELVENAIDAGASQIKINLKDAGRTLIQVSDNGCGMSDTDARMAFERHATSKIRKAKDLFAIRTMGFRGEALASIAAIANVELKTKRTEDELGTHIVISGSEAISQEVSACSDGSNFIVKNLFFNVPARRKFLKANSTELRNIITEFHRIVLSHPEIAFQLLHNDTEIYNLPASHIRQRIINVFGKGMNQRLISINTSTSIVKLTGFIGKPKNAKRNLGEQFFFVNNRYMRHPYFHKAIMQAYDKILPPETIPPYFIFFEVDPQIIDINMGCPAKKVCNRAAGSALMREPELVKEILEAVVKAVDLPVTLKMRTGWCHDSRNAVELARMAQAIGIQALAVHGRTRADGYRGDAEYDTIMRIRDVIEIPLFANGDINSPKKAKQVLDETGADAVMIGRAAQGRPWLFREINHYLQTEQILPSASLNEISQIMQQHLQELHLFYGELLGVKISRKHIGWYMQHFEQGQAFRKHFNTIESAELQSSALAEFLATQCRTAA